MPADWLVFLLVLLRYAAPGGRLFVHTFVCTFGNRYLAPGSLLGGGPGSQTLAHAIGALICLLWSFCLRRTESLALYGRWCLHVTGLEQALASR